MSTISVDLSRTGAAISRRLFGKFTEHLGSNVYGGAWAQTVPNPEFAPSSRWGKQNALQERLRRTASETNLPELTTAHTVGFAPYWLPRGEVAGCITDSDGGRDVQHLRAAGPARLYAPIYLPLHRVRRFELTLKARAEGGASVRVSICDPSLRPLASADIELAAKWRQQKTAIDLPAHVPSMAGQLFLLAIELPAGKAVELSRVLLFPADHLDGWDPEIVQYMRDARLPLLRFPGGNFVSGYHWRDGVGPLDGRPVLPNPAWFDVIECNHVGTDEWLRLCELVGCEALICVNAGDGTPREAREWIEYCNAPAGTPLGKLRAANGHPEPYDVRLWEVGNELYGQWQIGWATADVYARRYLDFVREMRRADKSGSRCGRNSLHFIANGSDAAWNAKLVEIAGKDVESITAHYLVGWNVPGDASPDAIFAEFMAHSADFARQLAKDHGPMTAAGLRPCLAITEQQVFTHHGASLPSNRSMTEALWTAGIIHACIRDGHVEMLTHSALVNHGGGLRKQRGVVWADPVWWVTHLYGSQDGTMPAAVEVRCESYHVSGRHFIGEVDVPQLDAVALADEAGKAVSIFVINRCATAGVRASIDVGAKASAKRGSKRGSEAIPAEVTTLAAESYLAANTIEDRRHVHPAARQIDFRGGQEMEFPPASITRIRLTIAH